LETRKKKGEARIENKSGKKRESYKWEEGKEKKKKKRNCPSTHLVLLAQTVEVEVPDHSVETVEIVERSVVVAAAASVVAVVGVEAVVE
jgi:hypothetical protein